MKKRLLITGMLSVASLAFAQVGVNTPQAETTFDIVAKDSKGTSQVPEGLLIPRVDRERAQSMVGVPISTLIYINDISTGSAAGIAANVDEVGYYYYNGTVWTKISEGSSDNIHVYNADGIITANRTVTMQDRNFTFNSGTGSFSVNGNNDGITRANFTNQNTGTSSRSDINVGASNSNIYLGVDTGSQIFGAGKKAYLDNRSGGSLFIGNDGNAQITVDKSGKVGIGTTTPSLQLHVEGSQILNAARNASITKNALDINIGQDRYGYGNRTDNYGINIKSSSSVHPGSVARINFGDTSTGTANGERYLSFSVGRNLNELMYLTSANDGKVGIGTDVPTDKLHVAGSVKIADGTQGANKVLTSDASGKASWKDLPATSNVYNADGIITANRTVTMQDRNFTFNSGTGSFSVNGNNDGITRANFTNQNTGTSSRSDINVGASNSNIYLGVDTGSQIFGAGKKAYLDNRSGGSLFIGNDGNAQITVDKSGKIGIGTLSPTDKLHVAGSVKIADGTQGANKVLTSDASGKASWKDLPATSNVYNADGIITANRTVTMQDRNFTFNSGTGSFSVNGNNDGITRANFTNQNTGTSSRSDINVGASNSNIYLGVDTGSQIFGAGKKAYLDNRSGGSLFIGNDGNAQITVDKSGKIGIGTLSPTDKLHVAGSVKIADGTQGANKVLTSDASGKASWKDLPATSNTNVYNSNGTITSDRVVNIENKGFAFNGTRHNGFAVNKVGDNASSVLSADLENARVGIGTHSPTDKLHVAGKVRIEDGTQGINRVLTSDANGVASWKTSSAVTPTVLGSVNHVKRFVNDYSLIGSSVTLTPGRWLIHIGQLVINKTEATQTNNLWVRMTLSSSSSSLIYSGFNFLGARLVSGWLSPSISQDDGEGFSFLSGVIPVNVTSNITLYTWFRDNSRTSGTPPTAHVGSNQENYLFATPVN
ncbi:beta strand repeat-containing protein [Chryseobacterium sp. MMS23-Vi53]|uniref:beta strand repeat-containing protein n=1 Tax=Chryseobacterium sp. MMS23-Vi53 TaxID=3386644 RepID=UPI0039E74E71